MEGRGLGLVSLLGFGFGFFFFFATSKHRDTGIVSFQMHVQILQGAARGPEQERGFICKLLVLATPQNVFPQMYFTLIITAWWVYIKSL